MTPSLQRSLAAASETLDLATLALPSALSKMIERLHIEPGAQSYDTPRVGGHTTVRDDEGTPMPAVSDPTGEAAINTAQFRDYREAHRRAGRIMEDAEWFLDFVNRWDTYEATPDVETETEQANRPKCEWHRRYGYDVNALYKEPTKLRHHGVYLLKNPMLLCRWCADMVRNDQRRVRGLVLPTPAEIDAHARKSGVRELQAS